MPSLHDSILDVADPREIPGPDVRRDLVERSRHDAVPVRLGQTDPARSPAMCLVGERILEMPDRELDQVGHIVKRRITAALAWLSPNGVAPDALRLLDAVRDARQPVDQQRPDCRADADRALQRVPVPLVHAD